MKKKLLALIIVFVQFIYNKSFCQSLNSERINHIKSCTVRITVDGTGSVGTGFVIDQFGTILTCWHVVKPLLITGVNNQIIGYRKVIAEFNDGRKIEYGIPLSLLNKGAKVLLSYDICGLVPNVNFSSPQSFLKIGNFSNLSEGDEVVTCGYPLGIPKQFVSKGIISTKFQDTSSFNNNGIIEKTPVNYALMDITMNKGNSGGAIIKLGNDVSNDEVIGIADFIITPVGKDVSELLDNLKVSSGVVKIGGIDPNETMAKITGILTNMSNGISGCVSIEYLQNLIDSTK